LQCIHLHTVHGAQWCIKDAEHVQQGSSGNQKTASNTAPLLQDSAAAWVSNLPSQSLAFLLWDAGYDVWLGNVRGSTWGILHSRIPASDPRFWQFTWDDMAAHDLPTM
jgi:hypothetical protein